MSAAKKGYFFRVGKIRTRWTIKAAARHNKRQIQRELGADSHIAPHLMDLNQTIYGESGAEAVAELAERLMREAGIVKPRKNAVYGLEAIFSLPLNHGLDEVAYFKHCAKWFIKTYGGILLSADIHRDEAAPHCHVLMLPLIDGRLQGNKAYGKKAEHHARVNAFFDDVAASYGLQRPVTQSKEEKEGGAELVVKTLKATNDPALKSAMWHVIRQDIEADPRAYMLALGLTNQARAKPMRTMAQIFTSKGKGGRVDRAENPIAFCNRDQKSGQPLPMVASMEAAPTRH